MRKGVRAGSGGLGVCESQTQAGARGGGEGMQHRQEILQEMKGSRPAPGTHPRLSLE